MAQLPAVVENSVMHACYQLCLGLLLTVAACNAVALEIHQLEVSRESDEYHMLAESSIAAPRDFIHAILMDFDNFHRLAGGISETRYLTDENSDERLGYTLIESCVLFFCKSFERVERIEAQPPEKFSTEAIVERSDFKSYRTEWLLREETGGTRVYFSAAMRPDFWIPPMLGSWAVRRKLEVTVQQMGQAIEYLYSNGLTLADIPPESDPD